MARVERNASVYWRLGGGVAGLATTSELEYEARNGKLVTQQMHKTYKKYYNQVYNRLTDVASEAGWTFTVPVGGK